MERERRKHMDEALGIFSDAMGQELSLLQAQAPAYRYRVEWQKPD